MTSSVLPRVFGYLALLLAAAFLILGIMYLMSAILPAPVTAFAGVQALWWLAAAIALVARAGKSSDESR